MAAHPDLSAAIDAAWRAKQRREARRATIAAAFWFAWSAFFFGLFICQVWLNWH